MKKPTLQEIETKIRKEYYDALNGERVNDIIAQMSITAAAKRVLAGEVATVKKDGHWVRIILSPQ